MLLMDTAPTSSRTTRAATRIRFASLPRRARPLENILQRELHHAHVAAQRLDAAEARAAQGGHRVALAHPVERVERFDARFDLVLVAERELAHERQIDDLLTRTEVGVALGVAVGADRRLRE